MRPQCSRLTRSLQDGGPDGDTRAGTPRSVWPLECRPASSMALRALPRMTGPPSPPPTTRIRQMNEFSLRAPNGDVILALLEESKLEPVEGPGLLGGCPVGGTEPLRKDELVGDGPETPKVGQECRPQRAQRRQPSGGAHHSCPSPPQPRADLWAGLAAGRPSPSQDACSWMSGNARGGSQEKHRR